ncbi:hypothetical protein GCM10018793_57170 [Streptomyces sulfonofaciens]|uniref:Uncharacterized protein n=1 Tax=Streptomyces sulfonofaciens TaxID=68272 RepID=A0A919GM42_9ACTN|nr:hypothetical protein GCM10018793_57170 [Streptomyces sulfonofaciens]
MTPRPAGFSDHFAPAQLLTETARRIGTGHAVTVRALFTEDGAMRLGGTEPRGRGAIRLRGSARPALRTRHVHLREAAGASGATAVSRGVSDVP